MSQTKEAQRNILVNELVVACSLEPGRALTGAITRVLEKAWKENFDGLELLFEALEKIKRPSKLDLGKMAAPEPAVTSTKARMACTICTKIFEKGVNSWIGNKRMCKLNCTVENLVPA